MKTYGELLSTLPPEVRTAALDAVKAQGREEWLSRPPNTRPFKGESDIAHALSCAFDWHRTPEGIGYWCGVCACANRGGFDPS